MIEKIYDEALKVHSVAGAVEVDCPDGARVIFTAEAAIQTGSELLAKAAEASGKRAFNRDALNRKMPAPFPTRWSASS